MITRHTVQSRPIGRTCILMAVLGFSMAGAGLAQAEPLDPLGFTSLGTLNLSGGNFTIDTDALTISDDAAPAVALFIGVTDDQNGAAMPDVVPEIAVFTFDSIDLDATANVTITGSRAVALLSQGDATIGTPLSVDGQDGLNNFGTNLDPLPGGVGGPGGFAGGDAIGIGGVTGVDLPGRGPGGGMPIPNSLYSFFGGLEYGGPGSFGGQGTDTPGASSGVGPPGTTYGDLTTVLQGGSGGATRMGGAEGFLNNSSGGGGGGAIELRAVGLLAINAEISARGGLGIPVQSNGGAGSGGGIRVGGAQVALNADLVAIGGVTNTASSGGGGRVFVQGLFNSVPLFPIESGTLASAILAKIDVKSSFFRANGDPVGIGSSVANFGVITISPTSLLVPAGQILPLGQPVDVSTATDNIELIATSARFQGGAIGTVDAAGYTNRFTLELADASATINGLGLLTNEGELTGSGRFEVPVANAAGGEINTVGDALTFTQPVTNLAGASINSISSTLDFPGDGIPTSSGGDNADGLTNLGDLNLINTTLSGDVHSPAGSMISVGGAGVVFNGLVSGAGNFPGAGAVTFAGGYAPGD